MSESLNILLGAVLLSLYLFVLASQAVAVVPERVNDHSHYFC